MNLKTAKIVSALVTVVGSVITFQSATFRWPGNQQGYQPVQPIAFSHKVHAGDNQIPCLYCHWAAGQSSVAGIPAASICMNCHSQIRKDAPEVQKIARALAENQPIQWVRVHHLPDHAVFNHSRHVTARIQCQTCHGPVETMERVYQFDPFSMGTCVSCHRTHREVTLDENGRPQIFREATPARLMASTDCSVCHH